MQLSLNEKQRASINTAIREGRKIEAIKELREVSGLGLADAKAVVETLERELRAQDPEFAKRQETRRGCGTAVLLILVGGGALRFFLST